MFNRRSSRKYQTEVPCENCGTGLPEELRYTHCPTCWHVTKTLEREGASHVAELADPHRFVSPLLWRVADIVRRSRVEDAEILIQRLERHFN